MQAVQTNGVEVCIGCVDSKCFDTRVVEVYRDQTSTAGNSIQQCLLRRTDKTSTDVCSEHLL